jgi:predicted Zn-dependent protease
MIQEMDMATVAIAMGAGASARIGRLLAVALALAAGIRAQDTAPAKTAPPDAAQAIALAGNGHCAEALPRLRAAFPRIAGRDQRRAAGAAMVRCAMQMERIDEAVSSLRTLNREFPGDADVLYLSAHVYSDLSLRASRELMRTAPASPQLRELSAETFEAQGRWEEAAREYRAALERDPHRAGIHFRIGRLLLSRPGGEGHSDEARAEFEAELKINPEDATCEFVLGELDSQAGNDTAALERFERATKLDAAFTEAWVALGRALVKLGRGSDAISPLLTAERLQPEDPQTHFQLAQAYRQAGRKEDATRELRLHREKTERIQNMDDQVRRGIRGIPDKQP